MTKIELARDILVAMLQSQPRTITSICRPQSEYPEEELEVRMARIAAKAAAAMIDAMEGRQEQQ